MSIGHAKELAVIDRRRASVESGPLDSRFELHRRAPDLPAGFNVDGEGPFAVDHVHDAVVDRWRRQFTLVVHEARAPDGHQALDVGFVDLLERAVALAVVAHALGGDVFRVLAVVHQVLRRLRQSQRGPETEQHRTQPNVFHDRPLLVESGTGARSWTGPNLSPQSDIVVKRVYRIGGRGQGNVYTDFKAAFSNAL